MPAVSGLLYRMKQNAVGLASIAILATGVLVMISTTVSLYAGAEETVKRNFPQDYYLSARYLQWSDEGQLLHSEDMPRETLLRAVEQGAEKNGLTIKEMDFQEYLTVSYRNENGGLYCRQAGGNAADSLKGLSVMTYITQEMYRSLGGEELNLAEDEIAVCPMDIRQRGFDRTEITIEGDSYRVKTVLPEFPIRSGMEELSTHCYGVVVADESVLARLYAQQKQVYGNAASDYTRRIAASFAGRGANGDVGEKLERDVEAYLKEAASPQQQESGERLLITGNTVWGARESVTAMCGALLFLGIILGLVCLFATVLIVYYKQISEGYEDRARFQIMQKVGMSRREVKSTINSQVLLVFFLPLGMAGLHLLAASPMLCRMLGCEPASAAELPEFAASAAEEPAQAPAAVPASDPASGTTPEVSSQPEPEAPASTAPAVSSTPAPASSASRTGSTASSASTASRPAASSTASAAPAPQPEPAPAPEPAPVVSVSITSASKSMIRFTTSGGQITLNVDYICPDGSTTPRYPLRTYEDGAHDFSPGIGLSDPSGRYIVQIYNSSTGEMVASAQFYV